MNIRCLNHSIAQYIKGVTVHGFRGSGFKVHLKPACRRCRLRGGAVRRAGLSRYFMSAAIRGFIKYLLAYEHGQRKKSNPASGP